MRTSVVVPVFNAQEYLRQCLQSIQDQTIEDFEVVCVDDGSTDGSASIVETFVSHDQRFRLIKQKNGGASVARNTGFDASTGQFVTFVDADDEVTEDFLEVLLHGLEENSADIAIGNKTIVNGRKSSPRRPVLGDGFSRATEFKKYRFFNHFGTAAKLYRRAFLVDRDIRYFEGITYEDYIHWIECLTKNPLIATVSHQVYLYKKNPNSISSRSQRLRPFNTHSRVVQTLESFRIAGESDIPGLEKKVRRNQLQNTVMRHITAVALAADRQLAGEAFEILSDGLQPLRATILGEFRGWRRLVYKILLDGSVEDISDFVKFVRGETYVSTRVERAGKRPNLYVSKDAFASIRGAKEHFFNVADLVR